MGAEVPEPARARVRRKPAGRRFTHAVSVRFTEAEMVKLQAFAAHEDRTLAGLLRWVVIRAARQAPVDRQPAER